MLSFPRNTYHTRSDWPSSLCFESHLHELMSPDTHTLISFELINLAMFMIVCDICASV